MSKTLQALSLVEKSEPVQVRFTPHLRDQRSMWMQDGCKVYMDSYMASNGPCFILTWTSFKNHLLEVGQHKTGRPWHSKCSQPLIYFILSCVRIRMNRNLFKKSCGWGPVTYGFTIHLRVHDHTTWFWRCHGTTFGHFLLSSHNFMVMAPRSCVQWPSSWLSSYNCEK